MIKSYAWLVLNMFACLDSMVMRVSEQLYEDVYQDALPMGLLSEYVYTWGPIS